MGSTAEVWDPPIPEIEQIGARLTDLDMQMGPTRDSGTSVVAQRFSEVQARLQGLERDLSANGP
jgi:hypothetical protein